MPILLLVTVFIFSLGLWVSDGFYSEPAYFLITLSVGLSVILFIYTLKNSSSVKINNRFSYFLFLTVLGFSVLNLVKRSGHYHTPGLYPDFYLALPIGSLLLIPLIYFFRENRKLLYETFILFLILYTSVGVWTLVAWPSPDIDTWVIQQEAAKAIVDLKNPYQLLFKLPGPGGPFTPADQYVYPPLPLFLGLPFYLIFKDIRFAGLAGQLVATVLLFKIARNHRWKTNEAMGLAALFLLFPRSLFVLEKSWNEALMLPLLLLSVYCLTASKKVWGPFTAGLTVTAKQYLLPLAPLYWRFFPRRPLDWFIGLGAAIFLPLIFYLMGPEVFLNRIVHFHFSVEPRPDALGLAPWLFSHYSLVLPSWVSFLALAVIFTLGMKIREQIGFGITGATGFLVFFWLSKIAFLNYYYLVFGFLVLALALMPRERVATPGC